MLTSIPLPLTIFSFLEKQCLYSFHVYALFLFEWEEMKVHSFGRCSKLLIIFFPSINRIVLRLVESSEHGHRNSFILLLPLWRNEIDWLEEEKTTSFVTYAEGGGGEDRSTEI